MFTQKTPYEFLSRDFAWLWAGLTFQAGFANAGGFLASARFVSHMTGFGTQVGISLSSLDYLQAIEMFSAPLSFLLGAMVSALAVDRPLMRGERPKYLRVMFGITMIFAVAAVGGINGVFGTFGEPLLLERDYALMCLLCFACGMQNACFVSVSRGQIRTTHMTGILTDIGIVAVRLMNLDKGAREAVVLARGNAIRILSFFSFALGSAISAVLFKRWEYWGFGLLTLFSLGLFLALAWVQAKVDRRLESGAEVAS